MNIDIGKIFAFLLIAFFVFGIFVAPIIIWKDASEKEDDTAHFVRSCLQTIYPRAVVHNNLATFIHGGLKCTMEWFSFTDKCHQLIEGTTISLTIPDWMENVLKGKKLTIGMGVPSQFSGFLKPKPPQEYTDFVEGRLEDRVPSCPFVNAKYRHKAMNEALQHDLELYRLLRRAASDDPTFPPKFALKGKRFSAEIPTLLRSGFAVRDLTETALAILERAYLVACQLEGVQPVERAVMDATLGFRR